MIVYIQNSNDMRLNGNILVYGEQPVLLYVVELRYCSCSPEFRKRHTPMTIRLEVVKLQVGICAWFALDWCFSIAT